ncbi:hypothetical protein LQZ18_15135 [Lachnospiraceae bacterium ZAX-1]
MYIYIMVFIICLGAEIYAVKRKRKKKWLQGIGIILFATLAGIGITVYNRMETGSQGDGILPRNATGEGEYSKGYRIDVDGIVSDYPMEISIQEQKLTNAQAIELFKKAEVELNKCMLGENTSYESVMYDLNLPNTLQQGKISVEYTFDNYDIFSVDGMVQQENIAEDGNMVKVMAQFFCQDYESIYELYVKVVPFVESEAHKRINDFIKHLNNNLQKQNEIKGQQSLQLPDKLEQHKIAWREEKDNIAGQILLLGFVAAIGIILADKNSEKKKVEERKKEMVMDYPDIVSKFSLLMGAGMTVTLAWEKIVFAYQMQKKENKGIIRPGYEELVTTLFEIQDGIFELKAYEQFGIRCQIPAYRKFSSLLIQNVRKGTLGMQKLLDDEAKESFEQRKAHAKKRGEEAGTKLLLPMMLMLLVVLVVLMVPAGLSMQM